MREWPGLFARVAERYRPCGRATPRYVASKLRRDPVYRAILGEPGDFGDVLDLGCGRGQLGITLLEAGRARSVLGMDCNSAQLGKAERAARGLPFRGLSADLNESQALLGYDTVVIVDVLYQLPAGVQLRLLRQVARAARQRVLVRTLDPDRGLRSALTLGLERLGRRLSPNSGACVNALPIPALVRVLESQGFRVSAAPCWGATPFANVLLSARLLPHRLDEGGDAVVMSREERVIVASDRQPQAGPLGDYVDDP
jgi:SAM-dependent methyltransferase